MPWWPYLIATPRRSTLKAPCGGNAPRDGAPLDAPANAPVMAIHTDPLRSSFVLLPDSLPLVRFHGLRYSSATAAGHCVPPVWPPLGFWPFNLYRSGSPLSTLSS